MFTASDTAFGSVTLSIIFPHIYVYLVVNGNHRVHPNHQSIHIGANVSFTCEAHTRDIQWKFNGGELANNTITLTDNIGGLYFSFMEVIGVKLSNIGIYECYGYDSNNIRFKGQALLSLEGKK